MPTRAYEQRIYGTPDLSIDDPEDVVVTPRQFLTPPVMKYRKASRSRVQREVRNFQKLTTNQGKTDWLLTYAFTWPSMIKDVMEEVHKNKLVRRGPTLDAEKAKAERQAKAKAKAKAAAKEAQKIPPNTVLTVDMQGVCRSAS